jgi:glutamate-5-semialdehyde dehydrogenase
MAYTEYFKKAVAAGRTTASITDDTINKVLTEVVPLGVVGVIYEARPNVTFDVFALCFKTGNISILKGGSDADNSNRAIIKIIHGVLSAHNIDVNFATLLPVEREATEALLNAVGFVDVLIPRGSQSLINYVRDNSKVPVIETGAGIVHTYFDETGDLEKAVAIIDNAKTRRVSVCNALDWPLQPLQMVHSLAWVPRLASARKSCMPGAQWPWMSLQVTNG